MLEFLSRYEAFATPSFFSRCSAIRNYIRQQVERGELVEWTVAVVSKRKSPRQVRLGDYDVNLVERGKDATATPADRLRMRGVVGSEEEALDLSPTEYKVADKARASKEEDALKFRETVRNQRPATRGLLLIYPLKVRGEDTAVRRGFHSRRRPQLPGIPHGRPAVLHRQRSVEAAGTASLTSPMTINLRESWIELIGERDPPRRTSACGSSSAAPTCGRSRPSRRRMACRACFWNCRTPSGPASSGR